MSRTRVLNLSLRRRVTRRAAASTQCMGAMEAPPGSPPR